MESIACTTGTAVASGSYTGAPAPGTTTVNASALRETLNPIRVCVTDAAGNLASQTIYVVKDLTAPAVTVDSVSDTLIGSGDAGTDVTWHANDVGTYSIRVGGTSCTTGTEVASGVYTPAPARRTTTVSTGDLIEGANTIRVCVTDLWGNEGTTTTSVVKDTTAPGRRGRRCLRHPHRPHRHGHRRHLARGRERHLQRAGGRRGLHDR